MKGLILSGGTGTRMMPLTSDCPKQLLPISNKPILINIIEMFQQAGILDIVVVVGDTYDQVQKHLGKGEKWGVNLTYQHQSSPLGLAHAVKVSKKHLGEEDFVMILGDNYFHGDLKEIIDLHNSQSNKVTIAVKEVNEPERYGIAYVEEGKVVKVVEKPKNPTSNLAILGLYVFNNQEIFKAIKKIKPSWRNELEITDAIQEVLVAGHPIGYYPLQDNWLDVGTPEDLLAANKKQLKTIVPRIEGSVDEKTIIRGNVVIEKGARVINSVIEGPVYIGKDTLIQDSIIKENTCIGDECRIVDSKIAECLVLSKVNIYHVTDLVINCILGNNSLVEVE